VGCRICIPVCARLAGARSYCHASATSAERSTPTEQARPTLTQTMVALVGASQLKRRLLEQSQHGSQVRALTRKNPAALTALVNTMPQVMSTIVMDRGQSFRVARFVRS